jgi:hypothetical protein
LISLTARKNIQQGSFRGPTREVAQLPFRQADNYAAARWRMQIPAAGGYAAASWESLKSAEAFHAVALICGELFLLERF